MNYLTPAAAAAPDLYRQTINFSEMEFSQPRDSNPFGMRIPYFSLTKNEVDATKPFYYAADLSASKPLNPSVKDWQERLNWYIQFAKFLIDKKLPEHVPFLKKWREDFKRYFVGGDDTQMVLLKTPSTAPFYRMAEAFHTPTLAIAIARAARSTDIIEKNPELISNPPTTTQFNDSCCIPLTTVDTGQAVILPAINATEKAVAFDILNSPAAGLLALKFSSKGVFNNLRHFHPSEQAKMRSGFQELANSPYGSIPAEAFNAFQSELEQDNFLLRTALPFNTNELAEWGRLKFRLQEFKSARMLSESDFNVLSDWVSLKPNVNPENPQYADVFQRYANMICATGTQAFAREQQMIQTVKTKVEELIDSYKGIAADVLDKKINDSGITPQMKDALGKLTGLNAYKLAHPQVHQAFDFSAFFNPLNFAGGF